MSLVKPDPQVDDLVSVIQQAVREVVTEVEAQRCLSQEEQEWVRKAIEAESRKIKFRDAVIEKSLTGLVWAALIFIGAAIWSYLKQHIAN